MLKLLPFSVDVIVAPFTGAWVEIFHALKALLRALVAPFTGAWVEILL